MSIYTLISRDQQLVNNPFLSQVSRELGSPSQTLAAWVLQKSGRKSVGNDVWEADVGGPSQSLKERLALAVLEELSDERRASQ